MSREKAARVLELLIVLAENCDAELSQSRQITTLKALAPFDLADIEKGLLKLLETSRFMPKVAEMLDAIRGDQQEEARLEAEGQWRALLTAMDAGAFHPYVHDRNPSDYMNPTALVVLRQIGGADYVNTWINSDLHWRKNEWVKLYLLLRGNEAKMIELSTPPGQIPTAVRGLIDMIGGGAPEGKATN